MTIFLFSLTRDDLEFAFLTVAAVLVWGLWMRWVAVESNKTMEIINGVGDRAVDGKANAGWSNNATMQTPETVEGRRKNEEAA